MAKINEIETGQCYFLPIAYRDDQGNLKKPIESKNRPVILFKDPFSDTVIACTTTTKVENPRYQRNGVKIQELQGTGLTRPTIIRLEYHCRYIINPEDLMDYRGQLSDRDIDNFLEKLVKVRQREYKREINLEL